MAAKRKLRKAKNIWAVVKGPAAAMVASCHRLVWKVNSGTSLRTDREEPIDLLLDPPAVVKFKVIEAQLARGGSGAGALMEPIYALLRSKENSDLWNAALRGALRSAIAGRQYTQARAYAAGWTEHSRCLFCLYDTVLNGLSIKQRSKTVEADNQANTGTTFGRTALPSGDTVDLASMPSQSRLGGGMAFGCSASSSDDTVHPVSKPTLSHGSKCKFKVEATAD